MTTKRKLGNIRMLPNGRFYARIMRGYTVEGKPRTLSKTFDNESDAEEWLIAQSVKMDDCPDLGARITLKKVWSAFKVGKNITKTTMKTYTHYMDTVWIPLYGDIDITSIEPSSVQKALDKMTYQNAKHAKTTLASVLSYAKQHGVISRHPFTGHRFTFPKQKKSITFDDDPFAAIEGKKDVWSIENILRCFVLIRGYPLEPAWLACIGAGLRVEEALALRKMDVRRVKVGDHMVTQLAIHAARTGEDGIKSTKTAQSVRIVGMVEPFGERYWEICQGIENRTALVCPVSAKNQNKRWRAYFEPVRQSKHMPKKEGFVHKGILVDSANPIPYIPLSKMRNTHVTMLQEAGVSDSINALIHGHTEMVERKHYMSPDLVAATVAVSERLKLVV